MRTLIISLIVMAMALASGCGNPGGGGSGGGGGGSPTASANPSTSPTQLTIWFGAGHPSYAQVYIEVIASDTTVIYGGEYLMTSHVASAPPCGSANSASWATTDIAAGTTTIYFRQSQCCGQFSTVVALPANQCTLVEL
jgi:hypothetical protein